MEELKIVYLPPGELTPYEGNARRHAEEDLAAIRASIEEVGFLDPIGIWGKNNLIVEGHGRQMVALEMGLDKVPCIRLDQLTDAQRRVYALAHNKTAEMSGWDFTKLEAELADLDMDFDMSAFGFTNMDMSIADMGTQIPLETKQLEQYAYIHYLVTIPYEQEGLYADLIDSIRQMGAEVKETKNNT